MSLLAFKMPERYVPLVPVPCGNMGYFYSEMVLNINWSEVQISPAYSLGQNTE